MKIFCFLSFLCTQSLFELELAGCNEVTEAGLWSCLTPRIVSLSLADCINIADEAVGAVAQLLPSLYEFSLQVMRSHIVSVQILSATLIYFHSFHTLIARAGLSRYGCSIRVLLAETKPQLKHIALTILLGADEPWHC